MQKKEHQKTEDPALGPKTPKQDGSPMAPPGLERTKFEMPAKRRMVGIGLVVLAIAILVALYASYQAIFFVYMVYMIFILMFYVVLWMDHTDREEEEPTPERWPDLSVIIPSYNSRHTIFKCIQSCQAMHYPKKIEIIVVDDGSKDGSGEELAKRKDIVFIKKEKNAGKAAALNTGIGRAHGEIIACVDSDTYPAPDALERCVGYFEKDPKVGSVVLFVNTTEPKNWLEKMQQIEYWISFGFFFRTLSAIGGLYVTPGPMACYRKSVFDALGGYDEKNLGEDMEIALRMQKNGWKIRIAPNAIAYTEVPSGWRALYKQRLRWQRSAILNVLDYSDMFFEKKYGYLGGFVLPYVLFNGLLASLFIFWSIFNLVKVGWNMISPWLVNFFAMVPSLASQEVNLYMLDSVSMLGFVSILIFGYFMMEGFRLAKRKPGVQHVLPALGLVAVFPFFLGITFLSAYFSEFAGRKYKW